MLTADLIVARSRRGRLEPRWIDPEDDGLLARAELILSLFRTGVGQTRAELREQFEHYGECHTHAYSSKCSLLTPLRPPRGGGPKGNGVTEGSIFSWVLFRTLGKDAWELAKEDCWKDKKFPSFLDSYYWIPQDDSLFTGLLYCGILFGTSISLTSKLYP